MAVMEAVMEAAVETNAVFVSTLDRLIENTRFLQFGKLRKTTFYEYVAESFRQTEGLDAEIRRALAFSYLMEHVEKVVLPYEKIGGSIIGMWPEVEQPPYESQYNAAKQHIQSLIDNNVDTDITRSTNHTNKKRGRWALMARDHFDSSCEFIRMQTIIKHLQGEFKGKLKDVVIAKACEDFFEFDYGIERKGFSYVFGDQQWYAANHMDLDYGKVTAIGWGGIRKEVEAKIAEKGNSHFYEACIITLDAVEKFINDYADKYLEAGDNPDYRRIGSALKHVATERPRGFFEAVQLTWINHIICNMQLGSALSLGRFDQYINPFYQMDKGTISEEEAVELIANCLIKVNEPKMRTVQSIVIGGTKRNGEDAYNDVTALVLKASRASHFPYPNVAFRVNKNIPQDLVDLAIEDIKAGHGMPMLVNDDVWIPNFIRVGHKPEDARDFYNMGCVEMLVNHASAGWVGIMGGSVDYPQLLAETLKKRDYTSFEDLFNEYVDEIRTRMRSLRGKQPTPPTGYDALGSMLLDGCIENGVDMLHGGTRLGYHIAVGGTGLATAADSLASIRYAVFDSKKMSFRDYLAAVAKNFEGNELLRQEIISRAPHFGNDGDVDALAKTMFDTMTGEVMNLNDGGRNKWVTSYFSYTGATSQGEVTPTTPDGRLDGEPISDGLGPSQGRDVSGPTKLMNSLLKLNYNYLTGALATNIRLNPSVFSTKAGTEALKDLLFTYLKEGGPQVQVNFVKKEDLEDAKLNPHKHQDLVVRVAGFCATFIELDDKIQNEIISRTEHE